MALGIMATEGADRPHRRNGQVEVLMGSGSHGQSLETTIAQVVADELGVDVDDVWSCRATPPSRPSGRAPAAAAAR